MDLSALLTDLDEKRGSTRCAAYKKLIAWLHEGFRNVELQGFSESITSRIGKSLRDLASTEERDLALHALARMLVTTWNQDYETVREDLLALSARGIIVAVECEVIALWIAHTSAARVTRPLIEAALGAIQPRCNTSRFAGCWVMLLVSIYSNEDIRDIISPECSWLCQNFLAASNVDDRVALGWAIASLLCATRATHATAESFDEGAELEAYLPLSDVIDSAHGSKPLKAVSIAFESGFMPVEKLSFVKQEFVFNDFRRILQIRFLRDVLGEGFYNQMAHNEFLQQALGFEVQQKVAKHKLSGVEKRLTRSPNSVESKSKDKELRRDRMRKSDTNAFDIGMLNE